MTTRFSSLIAATLMLALFTAACSDTGFSSPTSPSSTPSVSSATSAGDFTVQAFADVARPIGNAANSCPSDAPQNLRVGVRGRLAEVLFNPVVNVTRYQSDIEAFTDVNTWIPLYSPTFDLDQANHELKGVPYGQKRMRLRSVNKCGSTSAWTPWVQFTIEEPKAPAAPVCTLVTTACPAVS